MKSTLKLLALFLLWSGITFSQTSKTDTVRIYFQQDQSQLNAEGKKVLKNLGENSEKYESAIINGRASEEGETDYNQKLSAKRNKSIYRYLEDLKFDVPVSQNVLGENHPVCPNKGRDKMAANRMVEIILNKKPTDQELMDGFFADRSPEAKEYEFDPGKGIRILNSDNLYIYVPPYAFQFPNGQTPTGKVKLMVKQVKSAEEMILSGFHTESDHGLLQTAGMFDVQAYKGKQPLQLKPNSEIVFQVPADSIYRDMQIFQLKDSSNEWKADGDGAKIKTVDYKFNYNLFFKKNLTAQEEIEMKKNIAVLKYERRNMLDILIGGLARNKEEDKINRLIELFSIQAINMTTSDQLPAASTGTALYEKKTQRVLKMNDDQFVNLDFLAVTAITSTINDSVSSWIELPEVIDLQNAVLKYYELKFSKLMLLNCDRFASSPNKTDFVVSTDDFKSCRTYLIFPSINGLVPGKNIEKGKATFFNMPRGESSVVFAMGVKNGKWYYAKKQLKISNAEEKLEWQQADWPQIQKEMKNI